MYSQEIIQSKVQPKAKNFKANLVYQNFAIVHQKRGQRPNISDSSGQHQREVLELAKKEILQDYESLISKMASSNSELEERISQSGKTN